MISKEHISEAFKVIQDEICTGLEELDNLGKFEEDKWERPGGGGGRTRIIQNGNLIEKGGVNFSAVHGKLPEVMVKELGAEEGGFYATGVSIVLHPKNPHCPIIHMNIRYFEMENGIYWFGGGIDLTPHYVVPEEVKDFHQRLKKVCDNAHPEFYTKFKKWADDYFFIQHRDETRGVGGIFFDRLNDKSTELSKEELFTFVSNVGRSFVSAYAYQVEKNRMKPFTEGEREWQLVRRGRYVEFNLVYDKGTQFGLKTNGRIESILMSLPLDARWIYNFHPEAGSKEAFTLSQLKKGVNWVG